MKTPLKKKFVLMAALSVLLGADNACLGAVTFTITPTAVSNTYSGPITMLISNMPTGDTVVVQKFGDVNANGVIDAGDVLVQQFNLTDGQAGMVIGGVTNINVPGDLNSTTGAVTATLNFPGGEFTQSIIGKYGFILSSPVGHFTPITNFFIVTNFPYAQTITGNVVSNGASVAVPYATVVLFPAPRPGHDLGTPVGGTVANNLGVYTIHVPTGTYVPLPFQSNYVASYAAAPVLTLTNGQNISTNLTMTVATASISGKIVDANNSGIGLPGLFVPANNSSYFIASGNTDTNGNFTIRVTSGSWQLDGGPQGLALHGYVAYNNGTNVNAGTTGFVGAFYQATALFYGKVKDDSGNPLPGIAIGANDSYNSIFYSDGYSDANGRYVSGAVGGLGSGDPWQATVDNKSEIPNYLFSQSALQQNGGTNLAVGVAVHQNFTAILATNHIAGHVQFNGTNVVGVQVYDYATIGTNSYQSQMDTDANGNYSLNVANGDWTVNVYQCCDNNSLDNIIGNGNYTPPNEQGINITNNNGVANFTIQGFSTFLSGQVVDDGGNPVANMNVFAMTNGGSMSYFQATTDSGGNFRMGIVGGNYLLFLNNDPNTGYPSLGLVGPTVPVSVTDGVNINNFVLIAPQVTGTIQVQINNPSLSGIGVFASLTVGVTNYSSAQIQTDGSGAANVPVCNGTWQVSLNGNDVQNAGYSTPASQNVTISDNTMPATFDLGGGSHLQITTTSLPNSTNTTFYSQTLQASGGTPPYSWAVADYSISAVPANLTLTTNGVLSGTLSATTGSYSFDVQVTDGAATTVYQTLSVYVVNPPLPPLIITNTSLPNGNIGAAYSAQLGATGGQSPYYWTLASVSSPLPAGLSLNFNGLISGTPTTNKPSTFKFQVQDQNGTLTNKVLSITINSKPVLASQSWQTNRFQMRLTGAANQNYTLQLSTNLSSTNWTALFITNSATTNSFLLTDPNATNKQRFYRVLIGP